MPRTMRFLAPLALAVLLAAASFSIPSPAPAWTPFAAGDPHYLTDSAMLYRRADSLAPVTKLTFRTTVFRLGQEGAWTQVQTSEGDVGYVYGNVLSNMWVRVSKKEKRLYLYQGGQLMTTYAADFGYNPVSDKQQRGTTAQRDHWRTPEGTFFVVERLPRSQFYKAFLLNYPTAEDARRGLASGLISRRDHDAIVAAEARFERPPMNTALGGMIEIHGKGTGAGVNWTQGCVAIRNDDIDALWWHVQRGTPVVIEQ